MGDGLLLNFPLRVLSVVKNHVQKPSYCWYFSASFPSFFWFFFCTHFSLSVAVVLVAVAVVVMLFLVNQEEQRSKHVKICFEIRRAIMISTFLRSIFFTNAGSCLCYYLLKKDNSDLNRTYLYITTQLKSGYCRHSDTETIRRRLLNKVLSIWMAQVNELGTLLLCFFFSQ